MRTLVAWGVMLAPWIASADGVEMARRLDELYAQRHEADRVKELEALTAEALKTYPDDGGVLWRAARLKYWQCDGIAHPLMRRSLGKASWDYGERAVKLAPKAIESHFYAAIGLGCYAQAVGILKALADGLEGRFNERLDAAIKMDPSFQNAGPLIAKGRYYFELPWPKRDLRRSAEVLEKAVKTQPAALRAYLYLAETQLNDGAPQKAKETLNRVLQGAEGYDVAEARRVKAWAPALKAKIEEKLK
jgi:tetratricopeptide (TPR) repeat protein